VFSIEWPRDEVSVERCFKVYRAVYLLNQLSNHSCGKLLIPVGKTLLSVLLITIAFVLTCFWSQLDMVSIFSLLILFSGSLLLMIPTTQVMAELHICSCQMTRNLAPAIERMYPRSKKIHLRMLRACLPIRCQVGSLYHMDPRAKLTLANILANNFATVLIHHNSDPLSA
jgi:hypothetical protein